MNPLGTIRKPTGGFTNTGIETLEVLLEAHFPGSKNINPDSVLDGRTLEWPFRRPGRGDWLLAKRVITYNRIVWAINSFEAYKSPGPDEIFPALLQQGEEAIALVLCRIYRASLALGYIPSVWNRAKVVFIPKPGRCSYAEAKAFRPITLSSFLLKTMEKMLEKYLRETSLIERPLHPNQHAYQAGKSCESALHQLVSRVEVTLKNQEIALAAFLDIEGAFDNTSFESLLQAVKSRGVDSTICECVKTMLYGRQVEAALAGETMRVSVSRGCPQGGVLSPLLWDMVIDELLVLLDNAGYYTQGYADDVVILTIGKSTSIISELMQRALRMVEEWCKKENLRVNPAKTALVPFTKRKRLDGLRTPTLYNEVIQMSQEAKFLGVILDSKLNWNLHLQKMTDKCKRVLMTTRRTVGKTWGLKPHITHWLYTAVVRPKIAYGCLVWWPKITQKHAITKLSKIQRLACLCITGAIKSTPTAAMETMLNLPPLDIFIKGEARMGAYRLKNSSNWRTHYRSGHTRIETVVTNPVFDMGSDTTITKISYDKPFKVYLNWDEWSKGEGSKPKTQSWYTDGSKTGTNSGVGVYEENQGYKACTPLGRHTTVFQTEIYAIQTCAWEILRRQPKGETICILSDSQAALKALASHQTASKLVWECLQNLMVLSRHNKVSLVWVPGHKGIAGNETADQLAREGSQMPFTGPEPGLGITKSAVRGAINEWIKKQHQLNWNHAAGQTHSKRMMERPSQHLTADLLALNKTQLKAVTCLLTGHGCLRGHMHKMGIYKDEPLCRLCNEEEETASHIIFECAALSQRRTAMQSAIDPPPDKDLPHRLLNLIEGTDLFE